MEEISGLVLELGHKDCLVLTKDNNYVRLKLSGVSPRVGEMFTGYPAEAGPSLARRPVSRIWAYVASFLITLLVGGGGFVYAVNSPAAYVSVDMNSSVELVVNSLGKVIKASSFNTQGDALLKKVNVESLPAKEAVKSLVSASAQDATGEDRTVVITYTDSSAINGAELDKVSLGALYEAHFTGDLLTQLIDRSYRSKAASDDLSGGQLVILDLVKGRAPVTLEDLRHKNLNQVLAEHKIKLSLLINTKQATQKYPPNLIPVQADSPATHNSTDPRPNKKGTQPNAVQQTDAGSTFTPAPTVSQTSVQDSITTSEKVVSTGNISEFLLVDSAKGKEELQTETKTPKSPEEAKGKLPATSQVNTSDNGKSKDTKETPQKTKDTAPEKEKPKQQDNKAKTDKSSKGNSQQNQLLTLLSKPLQWSGLFA